MNTERIARLDFINLETRQSVLDDCVSTAAETLETIRAEPGKLSETRHSCLAGDYKTIALLKYALGYPLEEVRESFADSARTLVTLFQLRGTQASFPAYVLTYDPTKDPSEQGSHQLTPMRAPDDIDYSLTNSWKGYLGICQALVAGLDDVAGQLAGLLWDPPNADYISRQSETCTPNDQRLAFALKELLAGNNEGVLAELKGIRAGMKDHSDTDQATMMRALVTREIGDFCSALEAYLFWHRRRAMDKRNLDRIHFYLCLPGLALCGQAVRRGICTLDNFPKDDPFLPRDLIR